jgi:hypothetical protein
MWQVISLPAFQEFWRPADLFVADFLSYASDLHKQNLPDAALQAAAARPPGKLGQAATPTVQDYLVQFARCSELRAIRAGFRRAIYSYRTYISYPEQPLLNVTPVTHALVHEAAKYFYGKLTETKGFRETYLGLKGVGETGREYRKRFGELHRTCPYCDQEFVAKVSNTQIDHFLPKSQHPLLAIHWANLVVACVSCNAGVKLTTHLGHSGTAVENLPIFHPFYDQPADHIRCCFNQSVTRFWIRSTAGPGSLTATKVHNWSRVFGIEKQYEAHLPTLRLLARTLRDQTKQAYRRVRASGGTPDLESIYGEMLHLEERKQIEQRRFETGTKLTLDFIAFLRERKHQDLDFIRSDLM